MTDPALKLVEPATSLAPAEDSFESRHIGPRQADIESMLNLLGCNNLDEFTAKVVPGTIAAKGPFVMRQFNDEASEYAVIERLKTIAAQNQVKRPYIGIGYYGTITPPVIKRNILENPGWYTQYTPYQAEISQGRLEALLNFQTMISDLTGLPIANASLLDEGTAAAEAMNMSHAVRNKDGAATSANKFFVSSECFPQTIEVVRTRAQEFGYEVLVGDHNKVPIDNSFFGILLQYPAATGAIYDYAPVIKQAHSAGALVTVAADLLALVLLTPPGEWGADICLGNSQRFGVPLGYGGPHAAFFATKDEYKRLMPGRIIGVSKDAHGNPGLRLSLQTREQHIRREKATSNICTAQVLLAVMASMYAVYHGPNGLRRIAQRVNYFTAALCSALRKAGHKVLTQDFFDTVTVEAKKGEMPAVIRRAEEAGVLIRCVDEIHFSFSLDETVSEDDAAVLVEVCGGRKSDLDFSAGWRAAFAGKFLRKSEFLSHPVFNRFHSETEFLRYVKRLESRDLSLTASMIPLGSCTMKLNATSEMVPLSWPEFSALHPFAPPEQAKGYTKLFSDLEQALCEITGFDAASLQPNAGSQGEYAGLLAIMAYHRARAHGRRKICLIPKSAHGTNPASAIMAGMEVVVVECDSSGNIDLADLRSKAEAHKENLAALMVTYPSTHGVFEESIKEVCAVVHGCGAQVYMDGANLNALVGLCKPAEIGADVCHINLHKTFCIPHGGGGPGMGPIAVKSHLAPYLPGHPVIPQKGRETVGPVSAAPWGSASILTISWIYMALMGAAGLRRASQVAILNANYIAKRLEPHFPVLYRGQSGFVAHECILDLRELKKSSGIEVEDVAKRLMDYCFHAPTVSFPVAGTLMVEPTESESKEELDRFCEAMIAIRGEIRDIEEGRSDRSDNPLKNAPHTAQVVLSSEWNHPYTREQAAFPAPWLKDFKFWPAVGRVDSAYGDRNLVCACPNY